ncbi:MAG: SAM-dependent methyltransferase [Pseudomonadota bacterium]
MRPLEALIRAQIAASGPISIADYMGLCLQHPQHGYYRTRDPLGAAGDFTTAPEIHQMFGELIGLWLAQVWQDQGAPAPFVLAELGPGRGTLMADILRATRGVPGFHAAARIALVETSEALRRAQAERLANHAPLWCSEVAEMPDGPLFLIANEFFDALPIRQFQRDGARWRERRVGLDADRLTIGLSPPLPMAGLETLEPDVPDGKVVEHCPSAEPIAAELGRRIAEEGGAALVIDYGSWRGTGDTFQALRGHRMVDPLDAPGSADLTAHVRFADLARWSGLRPSALTGQGVFLERLGITARAQALLRAGAVEAELIAAHRRLTHPDEMGTLFKVLGLAGSHHPPLPALEERATDA